MFTEIYLLSEGVPCGIWRLKPKRGFPVVCYRRQSVWHDQIPEGFWGSGGGCWDNPRRGPNRPSPEAIFKSDISIGRDSQLEGFDALGSIFISPIAILELFNSHAMGNSLCLDIYHGNGTRPGKARLGMSLHL